MSRAGRKRKNTRRHPNGQVYRAPVDERETALKARERVFKVTAMVAAEMPETSFLGRLRATGELSRRQMEAANAYRAILEEFHRLYPTRGYPEAANLDRGGGHDSSDGTEPEYVLRFRSLTAKERLCRQVLQDSDHRAPNIVNAIVLLDHWQPQMIGVLRVGLNALANVLDIPQEKTIELA